FRAGTKRHKIGIPSGLASSGVCLLLHFLREQQRDYGFLRIASPTGDCLGIGVEKSPESSNGVTVLDMIFSSAPVERSRVEYVCRKVCQPIRLLIRKCRATRTMWRCMFFWAKYGV